MGNSEIRQLAGFDSEDIKVLAINGKRFKVLTAPIVEGKAYMTKKIAIQFTAENVGAIYCRSYRPPFRMGYRQCIAWRVGMGKAMTLKDNKETPVLLKDENGKDIEDSAVYTAEKLHNEKDFLPPLTMEENAAFIERLILEMKSKPKKIMSTAQFVVLAIIGVGALVVGVLNLMGVHFSIGDTQIIMQTISNATSTPIPPISLRP